MQSMRFVRFFIVFFALLSGCQDNDPLGALQTRGEQLQAALEAKDVSAVQDILHSNFQLANGQDAQWAERSMRLAFLRHRNISIVLLSQQHQLDNSYHDRAASQASIAISGAEGLLPERLGHYRVDLQWQQENGQWQLIGLHWQ